MKNKIVIVTGASRGYGYAIVEAMLNAGATVVIGGRSEASLKRAEKTLRKLGPVTAIRCDVRRERQVYALARRVVRKYGRIDVWVNNAGYSAVAGMMLDIPPKKALDMFLANDLGTLYGARAPRCISCWSVTRARWSISMAMARFCAQLHPRACTEPPKPG